MLLASLAKEAFMPTVNMLEAKTNLSRLVEAVEKGIEREVIIARNGKPAARLVPIEPKKVIRLGVAKGKFEVPADIDRDNDLISKMFYGDDFDEEEFVRSGKSE
jgi:prevent-host-death family protein